MRLLSLTTQIEHHLSVKKRATYIPVRQGEIASLENNNRVADLRLCLPQIETWLSRIRTQLEAPSQPKIACSAGLSHPDHYWGGAGRRKNFTEAGSTDLWSFTLRFRCCNSVLQSRRRRGVPNLDFTLAFPHFWSADFCFPKLFLDSPDHVTVRPAGIAFLQ